MNALPEPPDRSELQESFPRHVMRAGSLVLRVHRASREPYFFASDGTGRFDLVGSDNGTCYTALRDEGAFLEVFARLQPVMREHVRARRISEMMLKGDVQLADMTSGQVVGRYGLTLEVSAGMDYQATQQWAASLFDAGFGGV